MRPFIEICHTIVQANLAASEEDRLPESELLGQMAYVMNFTQDCHGRSCSGCTLVGH